MPFLILPYLNLPCLNLPFIKLLFITNAIFSFISDCEILNSEIIKSRSCQANFHSSVIT